MERDILEAVYQLGGRENFDPSKSNSLINKYGNTSSIQKQLQVVINHLVEERLLFPDTSRTGTGGKSYASGITPKGYRRLQDLKNPKLTWFKANWFAAVVALIAAASLVITKFV